MTASNDVLMNWRRDRFFDPPKFTKSFAEVTEKGSAFLVEWKRRRAGIPIIFNGSIDQQFPNRTINIHDQVSDGILHESKELDQLDETTEIINQPFPNEIVTLPEQVSDSILYESEQLSQPAEAVETITLHDQVAEDLLRKSNLLGELDEAIEIVDQPVPNEMIILHDQVVEGFLRKSKQLDQSYEVIKIVDQPFPEEIITLHDQVVEGILRKSEQLGQSDKAKEIVDQLKRAGHSCKLVYIKVYTEDTFLYSQLNKTLRENDFSEVGTLGPYAYLLYQSLINSNYMVSNITVYRGTTLTTEMIEEYKSSSGEMAKWLAFTSTSRNPRVADMFNGNTLFIIDIKKPVPIDGGYDISALSQFPQEQEVLLLAGGRFKIEKVIFQSQNNTHFIHLTIF